MKKTWNYKTDKKIVDFRPVRFNSKNALKYKNIMEIKSLLDFIFTEDIFVFKKNLNKKKGSTLNSFYNFNCKQVLWKPDIVFFIEKVINTEKKRYNYIYSGLTQALTSFTRCCLKLRFTQLHYCALTILQIPTYNCFFYKIVSNILLFRRNAKFPLLWDWKKHEIFKKKLDNVIRGRAANSKESSKKKKAPATPKKK